MTQTTTALETGTGAERPGVSTPPSGPLPTPIDEAGGYALQLHAEFWSSIPAKERAKIMTNFVARAKEAGTADTAKTLVRGFGVDVPDFGAAATILADIRPSSGSSSAGPGHGPGSGPIRRHGPLG